MLKWFKKHKLKFFSVIALSFCLSLFGFMAFNTKTYAFTIDNNGNLIGENLFDGVLVNGYHSGSNGVLNEREGQYVTNKNLIYIGNIRTITVSWSFNTNFNIYLDGIAYYDNNKTFVSYEQMNGQTSPKTVATGGNEYYISINFIANTNITLSNIYNVMINYGDTAKEWEPYGVWYNSTNYNLLESQINLLKYGWLNYIDELDLKITNSLVKSFTFDELLSGGYISTTSSFDLHQLSLYQNPNYSYIDIDIYFSDSLNNHNWFSYNLFNFSTKLLFNGVISIYDTDNNNVTFNIIDVDNINYENILLQNSNFNGEIESISIHFSSPDNATLVYTNSYFSLGFQNGVSQSNYIYQPQIDSLNNQVIQLTNTNNTLQDNLNNLQQSLSNLQVAYNDLNTSYTNMLNGNNFANLFFTIAETPFASFKQIWNVDFLGVNLAGFVTGILFIGLLIWVVKKIF